jgi:hypothetical protein
MDSFGFYQAGRGPAAGKLRPLRNGGGETAIGAMHIQLLQHRQHCSFTLTQTAFVQTLVAIAKALRIDPQPLMAQLEQAKIKPESTALENAEQTTRSRIELCYSRRWRELQFTIYLLIQ